MTSIYDQAFALLPGRGKTAAAVRGFGLRSWGLAAPVTHAATEPRAREALERKVRGLADKGLPVPNDIAGPVIIARRADELAEARALAMNAALTSIQAVEQVRGPGVIKPALAFLRDQLRAVTVEAAALAPVLAGIREAADVLKSDNPDVLAAWQRADALAVVYGEIRNAQSALYAEGWDKGQTITFTAEIVDRAGQFVDAVDHFRSYVDERIRNAHMTAQKYSSRPEELAEHDTWLTQAKVSPAFEQSEAPLRLVLFATTMTPWLPDVDQLLAAYADNTVVVHSPEQYNLEQITEARTRHLARVQSERDAIEEAARG